MLCDDAVHQALVEFGAAIDGNGAATKGSD
jgi:hypothetical protein